MRWESRPLEDSQEIIPALIKYELQISFYLKLLLPQQMDEQNESKDAVALSKTNLGNLKMSSGDAYVPYSMARQHIERVGLS